MAAPLASTDATNKAYVDQNIGGKSVDLSGIGPSLGDGKFLMWDATAGKWSTGAPVIDSASLTNVNAARLQGYAVSAQAPLANQVLKWNGSAWVASAESGGITSLTGDVLANGQGSVAATINLGAVTTAKIANAAITSAKIAAGASSNLILMTDSLGGSTVGYATCAAQGEVLKWTTTLGWQCASVTSLAPVTSVAGKTGVITLNTNDVDGLGTAAIYDVGTNANQVVRLDASARIPAVDGSLLTNVDAKKIQGREVASTTPTANQVLSWNNSTSEWMPTTLSTGSVTSVSVTSANGLGGSVATATTNPAITLTTSVNGLVKGNGTAFSAAGSADIISALGYTPVDKAALTSGKIWVGDATNQAAAVSVSGDASLSNSGLLTVNKVNGVTYASSPSTNTFPLVTGANTVTYTATSADTFSQYALLAGRLSGQTLNGGNAASANLTLDSTSDATKGKVIIAPNGGNVGIGTTAPSSTLQVNGDVMFLRDAQGYLGNFGGAGLTNLYLATNIKDVSGTPTLVDSSGSGWFTYLGHTPDQFAVGYMAPGSSTRTTLMAIGPGGLMGVGAGTVIPSARLELCCNLSAASWTTNGIGFRQNAATYTDTTGSGTIANRAVSSMAIPTLASTNGVTLTNASTFYIAGAPLAGTNTTITNPIAFNVASGISSFGGNVGVGTTSPGYKLDVVGAINAQQLLVNGTDISSSAGAWTVSGANAYRSSGNVGIGTNTFGPNGLLQINGDIGLAGTRIIRSASNSDTDSLKFWGNQLIIGANNSTAYSYGGGGLIAAKSPSDSALLLDVGRQSGSAAFKIQNTSANESSLSFVNSSGSAVFYASSNSGNVGIGNASPSAKLELTSGVANSSGLKFTNFTSTAPTGTGTPVGVDSSGNLITIPSGGSGTVTSVSVTSANGLGGSVATATTTPAITLTTSVNGIAKGNGTAFSAAAAGTDYSAGTSALATGILKSTTSTGALSIAGSSDITSALGYTPVNKAGDTMSGSLTYAASTGSIYTAGSGTNTVTVQGPSGAIGTSYVLRLPTAQGSASTFLQNDGSGNLTWAAPTGVSPVGSSLSGGQIWVGNSGNTAAALALSGDATLSNAGSLTLANSGVTAGSYTKVTVDAKGRVTNGGSIALTDMPSMAANTLIGNATGAAAVPTAVTLSSLIDSGVSNTQGSVLYRNNTGWVALSPGTSGQFLQTQGASANPQWATPSPGSTVFVNGGNSFGANATLGLNDNFDLGIKTNNTTRMTVSAAGNVGIGTTSPVRPLDVQSNNVNLSTAAAQVGYKPDITTTAAYYQTTYNSEIDPNVSSGISNSGYTVGSIHRAYRGIWATDQGTVATVAGGLFQFGGFNTSTTHTTTNAYGIWVQPVLQAGNFGTVAGIYLGSPLYTGATVTNQYGVYQADSSSKNFFAGNVGIGTTSSVSTLTIGDGTTPAGATADKLLITSEAAGAMVTLRKSISSGAGVQINLVKSRGSAAAPSVITSGDTLFNIFGSGFDGSNYVAAGGLKLASEGTISTGIVPSNIQLSTASTSGVVTERVRIDSSGNVGVGTTAPSARLEVSSGVANTSGLKFTNFTSTSPTGTGTPVGVDSSGNLITITSGGSGTVTSVSVASANGLGGTVATATTTPAITLTTSVSGMVKGNGTALSAATAGTDYSAGTSALATGILKSTTSTGALSIAGSADITSSLGYTPVNKTGDSMSGNITFAASTGNIYTAGSGTNTVTLQGPSGAVGTSYILRMPTAQGGASTFLQNDGSGNLTWASPSDVSPVGSLLTSGQIWVGSGSNVAAAVAVSGDADLSNAGALTVSKINGVSYPANPATSTFPVVTAANTVTYTATSADTFTQYALLAGRSGGQTIKGGTLASNNLTLDSTSSTTKGFVNIAPLGGNVGIGTTTPSEALTVNGSIRSVSVDNGSSTSIDWSKANSQYTAAGCTGTQYTFSNMRPGATYTLLITGTFSAVCTFGQTSPDTLSGATGGNFYFMPANTTASGSNAIFSFVRIGNNVYVSWTYGFSNSY